MTVAMFIFGLLTVASACGVVFFGKPLYSALSLVLTLFFVAINFALLGAQFLAATQIMVYAGAIMVLVVFVIMLLGLQVVSNPERKAGYRALALGTSLILILGLTQIFRQNIGPVFSPESLWKQNVTQAPNTLNAAPIEGTTEAIGERMFTKFIYPFEVVSLLLLAAIIGATVIAFEHKRALPLGRGLRAKQEENKAGQSVSRAA